MPVDMRHTLPFHPRHLDPGIRDTVLYLLEHGCCTTDSGDGVSKPPAGRTMEIPHVFMVCDRPELLDECDRVLALTASLSPPTNGGRWVVEGAYDPQSLHCVVALLGVADVG